MQLYGIHSTECRCQCLHVEMTASNCLKSFSFSSCHSRVHFLSVFFALSLSISVCNVFLIISILQCIKWLSIYVTVTEFTTSLCVYVRQFLFITSNIDVCVTIFIDDDSENVSVEMISACGCETFFVF